jgi:histidinol dehydrogenase
MEGTLDTILYPEREAWPRLMQRGITDTSAVRETVAAVLADVRRRGDQALLEYEERFDGVTLTSLRVSEAEMAEAESLVGEPLKEALAVAAANIRRFHEAQRMQPISVVTTGGVTCSQRAVPIQKVGLYVPGGTAPLFSTVLMLAIPAKIAGCRQIVLCTPPDRQGKIHPAILYAARMAGVTEIYKAGGLRHGNGAACLQDFRSGQPFCDGSKATGKRAECGHRHACRTIGSNDYCRRGGQPHFCSGRLSITGGTRS